jgi:hypothetical protein
MPLHQALRNIWERDKPKFGLSALDELTPVLMAAIRICGSARILQASGTLRNSA